MKKILIIGLIFSVAIISYNSNDKENVRVPATTSVKKSFSKPLLKDSNPIPEKKREVIISLQQSEEDYTRGDSQYFTERWQEEVRSYLESSDLENADRTFEMYVKLSFDYEQKMIGFTERKMQIRREEDLSSLRGYMSSQFSIDEEATLVLNQYRSALRKIFGRHYPKIKELYDGYEDSLKGYEDHVSIDPLLKG